MTVSSSVAAAPEDAVVTSAQPVNPTTPPTSPESAVPLPVEIPAEIILPTLGLRAPIVEVGVESDGLMEIPVDVNTVGWYRFGPAPGADAGSAVLTGHINDRDQGPGVFARIGELNPGDVVQTIDVSGATRTFSVIARESWPKTTVPLDRLFDRGGEARLVLITCGGVFDRTSGNYQDNIAVTAVPIQA